MNFAEHLPKVIIAVVLFGGIAAVVSKFSGPPAGAPIVDVKVPQFSKQAALGAKPFNVNCAGCHGANGSGSEKGPPLVHKTYNPGHHDNAAFFRATKNGVQAHHWSFGNMPPQPQVNSVQLASIIQYVRELQVANGIFYAEHKM